MSTKHCAIIGGGIIGLSTAYYLLKEGHKVSVFDKSDITKGASFVNAGFITPSHIIPLAAPGMITKGLKWMFNPSSPFYIKPRFDKDFLKWCWAFKQSATLKKVKKAIPIIKEINLLSRDLYQDIKKTADFSFSLDRKGVLMCYNTDKAGEEEWQIARKALTEGLIAKNLSASEVQQLDPHANLDIRGAVYYECDAHMAPEEYMQALSSYLKASGVTFYTNEKVIDFKQSNSAIAKIITEKRTLTIDEVVIAAGCWSSLFTEKLGFKIPLQAGKGYRINVARPTGITIPAILLEARVAVSPMNGFTRFAGTMEIGGINHHINSLRVKAIAKAAEKYYTALKISQDEIHNAACGLRPVSPDGLPYIGKTSSCKNATVATGHAMMGWSLAPATGKLVTEIINGQKPSINIDAFHPERSFY